MIQYEIRQLERQTQDGLVITAHWSAELSKDGYSASTYGTVSFERGDSFIPFENLTKEQVTDWVKAKLNTQEIENSLNAQIEAQKTPTSISGIPWGIDTSGIPA
jgi:hypothetical protein